MNPNSIVAQIVTGVALVLAVGCGEDDAVAPIAPVAPAGPVGSSPVLTEVAIPPPGLTGVSACSLAWGDCDNDGDLAVTGWTGSTRIIKVYENVGGAVPFDGTKELATGLTAVEYCSLAWGDADNDGDLDLAVAGWDGSAYVTKVYENDGPLPNVPPEAPTGLAADSFPGVTVLYWGEGLDTETPTEGLSYNLWISKPGQGSLFFPSMAAPDGPRRLPALGPVPWNPSYPWWAIEGLPRGVYEFRVQAIDSGLEGGPWSAPCVFSVS